MKQARRRSFEVLTVGAATRDIFVRSEAFDRVTSNAPDGFSACLPMGSKMNAEEMVLASGGGATNAAVTFARFGYSVACLSRIGRDSAGWDITHELKQDGVETSFLQIDDERPTAQSIIFLAGHGSRAILTARGASQHLDVNAFSWKTLSLKHLYLTSLGGNLKSLRALFSHLDPLTSVAWNPGNGELEYGLKTLRPWLMRCDVVIMNREEAAFLCGTAPRMLGPLFEELGNLPRQALVITDGAHGAYAHARGTTWHVPALKGKRVNTTGAGDAFGSAFAAALWKEGDIEMALRAGAINAFGVVTHMGAKRGIAKHFPRPRERAMIHTRVVSSL
jgi:sugar/nucleoside kinase (ribokinase family)